MLLHFETDGYQSNSLRNYAVIRKYNTSENIKINIFFSKITNQLHGGVLNKYLFINSTLSFKYKYTIFKLNVFLIFKNQFFTGTTLN